MWSEFFRYFVLNFEFLGLKELIATHYEPEGKPSYVLRYDGKIGDMLPKQFLAGVEDGSALPAFKTELRGNGDFRSEECVTFLKEADIVCTNPPFSLWRNYVAQLMDYKKEFIILGNIGSVNYKTIRPLIKNEKMWIGAQKKLGLHFRVSDDYEIYAKSGYTKDGKKFLWVSSAVWFTNIPHDRRQNEFIMLSARFNKNLYPAYDNFDAIDVQFVKDIPEDYKGMMGVPITFLTKHNPKQFEIVGYARDLQKEDLKIGGKYTYARIIIKHKEAS